MISGLDLHPRTLRRNIWRGLLSATDQEISDGLAFYPGAHGLCRLISSAHPHVTTSQVAGIYAALSPMNGWLTNVANIFDVLRRGPDARVNTSSANFAKALRIAEGCDPRSVLRGRKVAAFYSAINDPEDSRPIPVDRHLICLALGVKLDNAQLSRISSTHYSLIERVYHDLGRREGLGNRLASIAWFVQRRISRDQRPILAGGSPVCCGIPMWSHGHTPKRRWYCPTCRSTQRPTVCDRIIRTRTGWIRAKSSSGLRLWSDSHNRTCVTLPKLHPYANTAGYQRLARFLIAESLGYLPRPDEHTHHKDRDRTHDVLSNLELIAVSYHGSIHASAQVAARDDRGRFIPVTNPGPPFPWPRRAAVLGNAARS